MTTLHLTVPVFQTVPLLIMLILVVQLNVWPAQSLIVSNVKIALIVYNVMAQLGFTWMFKTNIVAKHRTVRPALQMALPVNNVLQHISY